jgi:GTP cyclohydrolase I
MFRVRVVSSYAADKLSGWLDLPSKCKDKTRSFHFPKVVTNTQETTQGFLDGYVDGDGCDFGSGRVIITANNVFAEELAECLQTPVGSTSGGFNSIYVSSKWHKAGWYGKHGFRQQSDWYIPQDSRYVEVMSVEPAPMSTKPYIVYSFKCEPHPTILVSGHLTHNCEHHLVPIVGKAHVGYVPDGKVIGLSEIANIVEAYARRPQIQERLTAQIADLLFGGLGSRGSMVVIEAEQLCMTLLGSQKPGSVTVTSAARGAFEEDGKRAEFMALIRR